MKKGFTLIELLIVITVSVILLTIGTISLSRLNSGNTVDLEAQQLVAVLRNAQEKAADQDGNSRWGVYFDTVAQRNRYSLYRVNETKKATPGFAGIPGDVIDTHTLDAQLLLTLQGSNVTSSLIFSKATGRPVATTTIEISSTGTQPMIKDITVTAQGRISYQ